MSMKVLSVWRPPCDLWELSLQAMGSLRLRIRHCF